MKDDIKEKLTNQISIFCKDKKAVVGVSGGIDSAVVLGLCVEALGSENVIAAHMPYGKKKNTDAINLCAKYGVDTFMINIKPTVDSFKFADSSYNKLSLGNIMARVRMTFLYAIANMENGLVMGTGNKSELAIGYLTKYGDGGVDCETIGALYKSDVYKTARELKIPNSIIDATPSADLWEGQTDENEMGFTYGELEGVLEGHIYSGEIYENVQKAINNSSHKRNMPPIFHI